MRISERIRELSARLRNLLTSRAAFDRDLDEEMRLHRDLRSRELEQAGAEQQEAFYAAQRRFGNTLRLMEQIHEAWGWHWLDGLFHDVRYGFRRLRKIPGFAAAAVVTLALAL